MGNWNESIYGGDVALKWKEDIYEFCKAKEYGRGDKPKPIGVKTLAKKMPKIIEMIDEAFLKDEKDGRIAYQVLGAIILFAGYDFDESFGLKEKIIEAIDEDDWAKESVIRKNVCKNFKKLVKEYKPEEPFDIETINVFEENDDVDEGSLAAEFKEVFSLINGRIKKLQSNIEEKSGNKDFDEGYETAAQESIDFLTDYKELVARQEMMGVLLERIKSGSISSGGSTGNVVAKSSGSQTDAGRADTMPG